MKVRNIRSNLGKHVSAGLIGLSVSLGAHAMDPQKQDDATASHETGSDTGSENEGSGDHDQNSQEGSEDQSDDTKGHQQEPPKDGSKDKDKSKKQQTKQEPEIIIDLQPTKKPPLQTAPDKKQPEAIPQQQPGIQAQVKPLPSNTPNEQKQPSPTIASQIIPTPLIVTSLPGQGGSSVQQPGQTPSFPSQTSLGNQIDLSQVFPSNPSSIQNPFPSQTFPGDQSGNGSSVPNPLFVQNPLTQTIPLIPKQERRERPQVETSQSRKSEKSRKSDSHVLDLGPSQEFYLEDDFIDDRRPNNSNQDIIADDHQDLLFAGQMDPRLKGKHELGKIELYVTVNELRTISNVYLKSDTQNFFLGNEPVQQFGTKSKALPDWNKSEFRHFMMKDISHQTVSAIGANWKYFVIVGDYSSWNLQGAKLSKGKFVGEFKNFNFAGSECQTLYFDIRAGETNKQVKFGKGLNFTKATLHDTIFSAKAIELANFEDAKIYGDCQFELFGLDFNQFIGAKFMSSYDKECGVSITLAANLNDMFAEEIAGNTQQHFIKGHDILSAMFELQQREQRVKQERQSQPSKTSSQSKPSSKSKSEVDYKKSTKK